MNILGKNVTLRAVELDDLDSLHRWSNDPEVQDCLGGWHFPLSKHSLQNWIGSFQHDSPDQRFIIEASDVGPVGLVTLTSINWKDRNGFHGLLIGERQHRRRGFGADTIITIMRYAFEELGMQRLDTTIIEFNAPSLALHVDKGGWVQEGRKESAVFRRNRFWANVILGVTRDQFAAHSNAGKFDGFQSRAPNLIC